MKRVHILIMVQFVFIVFIIYLRAKVIRKKHWDWHLYEAAPQSRLISGNYLNYLNHIRDLDLNDLSGG